jgi:GDP-D-mannose dehydratase
MTERKVALITGITGQDGSYLSEFLLDKGYEVELLLLIPIASIIFISIHTVRMLNYFYIMEI